MFKRKIGRVFSNSGAGVKQDYIGSFDTDGRLVLKESDVIDTYAITQADRLSCDINYIISRYCSGDVAALAKAQGTYIDVSEMPTNYADMLNVVRNAENAFDSLPVDVKASFDNNVNTFIATMGTDEWRNKLGVKSKDITPAIAEPIAKEVTKEVSLSE